MLQTIWFNKLIIIGTCEGLIEPCFLILHFSLCNGNVILVLTYTYTHVYFTLFVTNMQHFTCLCMNDMDHGGAGNTCANYLQAYTGSSRKNAML